MPFNLEDVLLCSVADGGMRMIRIRKKNIDNILFRSVWTLGSAVDPALLWSHLYLCPFFFNFTHTYLPIFVILQYLCKNKFSRTWLCFLVTECNHLHYSHHLSISLTKNIFVLLMSNIATLYTDALHINAFVINKILNLTLRGSVMIILIYTS